MNWYYQTVGSPVGKKIIMSLTGLFLCSFLVAHLSGNLTLFNDDGGAAFNAYAEFMSSNVIIHIMEIGLILGFLLHIVDSLIVTVRNWKARPKRYAVSKQSVNSSLASRTMIYSGALVLFFLVVHLQSFTFPFRFTEMDSTIYDVVVAAFHDPVYSGFYVVALILLGFHLNHGFQSAFQTLGLNHKKYTPIIKTLGVLFSIIVPAGFATMPIYFAWQAMTGGA
ncbi:MAG: succinate dehydrogenase [Ignavibacteriales bacterium]|jgi:succinate dehydrogenase / fumarate reductase, cytochrome b subunit|nr:succinate dehydrogenase [Ignavibacteriales bacterium]